MPIEITMPKLTDTMTDATLAKWLKKEGDPVKPGDMIAEVETDKATQELETFEAGTIAKIVVPEGGKTLVGALIVVLAKPGEDVKEVAKNVKPGAAPAKAEAPKAEAPKAEAKAPVAAPPVISKPEDENADDSKAAVTASGGATAGTTASSTANAPAALVEDHDEGTEGIAFPSGRVRVSPLARRIADEKGINLMLIRGTGPAGRIIKRDVLDFKAAPAPVVTRNGGDAAKSADAPAPIAAKLEAKEIPLNNMRQTIAKRLLLSKQTIPHFYVSIDVVMDKLIELRTAANEQIKPDKLTVTDFIARAVAVALTRVPAMNASFAETKIVQHGSVELGIAVALADGLIVPVIRGAHSKSVRQISQEIKQLSADAKANKLKLNQITGSTFTISNLGMYGVKDFMAIVNPPESAILAVGGTDARAIVKDGQVVAAQVMTLTLSADHRVVDGATGAKFISELKVILENPLTMLI